MSALVAETKRAWEALGKIQYGPTEAEKPSLRFRRSIYVTADLKAGERLTNENIRIFRPGYGLEPKFYSILLGRRINREVKKGTPLSWDLV